MSLWWRNRLGHFVKLNKVCFLFKRVTYVSAIGLSCQARVSERECFSNVFLFSFPVTCFNSKIIGSKERKIRYQNYILNSWFLKKKFRGENFLDLKKIFRISRWNSAFKEYPYMKLHFSTGKPRI